MYRQDIKNQLAAKFRIFEFLNYTGSTFSRTGPGILITIPLSLQKRKIVLSDKASQQGSQNRIDFPMKSSVVSMIESA